MYTKVVTFMLHFRRIMHEVFGAVKFMHDQDIVHRDLKVSYCGKLHLCLLVADPCAHQVVLDQHCEHITLYLI